MANTISTTWTLTQTRTPTLHPQPHAPSTCQLKRAAPHPLPQSVPTSTCAPLLPRPAPTPRDPPIAQEPCEEGRDEAHLLQELASSGPLYQGKNSCANFQPWPAHTCCFTLSGYAPGPYVPHRSFHHSSHPLRVTIIWSVLSAFHTLLKHSLTASWRDDEWTQPAAPSRFSFHQ